MSPAAAQKVAPPRTGWRRRKKKHRVNWDVFLEFVAREMVHVIQEGQTSPAFLRLAREDRFPPGRPEYLTKISSYFIRCRHEIGKILTEEADMESALVIFRDTVWRNACGKYNTHRQSTGLLPGKKDGQKTDKLRIYTPEDQPDKSKSKKNKKKKQAEKSAS
jgi:hypothetical protein